MRYKEEKSKFKLLSKKVNAYKFSILKREREKKKEKQWKMMKNEKWEISGYLFLDLIVFFSATFTNYVRISRFLINFSHIFTIEI